MIDRIQSSKHIFKSVLAALFLIILFNGVTSASAHESEETDSEDSMESDEVDPERELLNTIIGKFEAKAYREVIDLSNQYFEKYPLTEKTIFTAYLKATAHIKVNEIDQAIATYEKTLPVIRKLNNINQRKFAKVFFVLGQLYHETGNMKKAISFMEDGLSMEPQSTAAQMILGEYYAEAGKKDRAVSHYRDLLDGAGLKEEDGIVIRAKLKRLGAPVAEPPFPYSELAAQPFYKRFTIRILPINHLDPAVQIKDICPFLESKFLVRCELLDPMELDEEKILNPARDQYDGDRVLELLKEKYPNPKSSNTLLVAFTGKDIFAPKTNYVFSWQTPWLGIGVVSSKRFVIVSKDFEPEIISTRRVAIQFISTVSSLLGFGRTTKPHCPTSYPDGLDDFLLKGSKLCEQTLVERNEFLNTKVGHPGQFQAEQLREIERIYEKYSLR